MYNELDKTGKASYFHGAIPAFGPDYDKSTKRCIYLTSLFQQLLDCRSVESVNDKLQRILNEAGRGEH
jgi:hypothetical protein